MSNVLFSLYDSFSKNQMRDSWPYRSFDHGQKQTFICECPGIRCEDLHISLEKCESSLVALKIKGASEITVESEKEEEDGIHRYSRNIDFTIPLYTPYIEKVEWKLDNGILKIEVYKKEFDVNKIEIKRL